MARSSKTGRGQASLNRVRQSKLSKKLLWFKPTAHMILRTDENHLYSNMLTQGQQGWWCSFCLYNKSKYQSSI